MLKVVGQSAIRVDGLSKVTGRASYPQDIYIDGMLYGKTLRSTKPHAIFKIDTKEAEGLNGVIKILTYKDLPHNHYGVFLKDHEVFCTKKVRSIGDPIAFVVATTEKIAEEALNKIKVEYQELPGVFDPLEAIKPEAPKVHDKGNLIYHCKIRRGNVEEAFDRAAAIVENTYITSMVDHAFLQPEAGLAYLQEDKVVVCVSTQYPHFDQLEIAEALGVPTDSIKVINPAVGGAFGGREDITMQIHLALAAKATGRPVKTIYNREESFLAHSKRHPMVMKYKTAGDKEGRLLAMEATIVGDTGAYASWAINVIRKAAVHATGPYIIPNVRVDSYVAYTNNPFAGAMRGFGAAQVPVAHEQQMDMLAERLNIDPMAIRLRNCFRRGSITATGQILENSVPLEECLQAVEDWCNRASTADGGDIE